MKISRIKAIEVLDSRGNPTVRTFIRLENGLTVSSSVPSGASTGSYEALELRDGNRKRYGGKGVLKAVDNINKIISKRLKDKNISYPEEIDRLLIDLDGTDNKSHLGANAVLGVSQAVLRGGARVNQLPLWRFINQYYFPQIKPDFPRLMINLVNGGRHAGWSFDIQEFMISPLVNRPSTAVRIGAEIFHQLGKILKTEGYQTLVGDEGGYAPLLSSTEAVFQLLKKGGEKLGYQQDDDYQLAIDAAASEFFDGTMYVLKKENKIFNSDGLLDYYFNLKRKYNIFSFEDPFAEDDWSGFKKMTAKGGKDFLIVGDDLYVTNPQRIRKGIKEKATNAVLIKPNQIGTILETVEAIRLARQGNLKIIISHRSGETEDPFIADLAYGSGADFIKTGSMSRSERLAKYNRLIEIERLEVNHGLV